MARDPFGIKLIYYRVDGGSLYFGSEVRPTLATTSGKTEIDTTSLNLFLRYRFTPSPYTIFKGVRKLAPGTKLTVQNGVCEVSRWYKFRPEPFRPAKSPAEAREELLSLYKGAIKRQLISDVPVGLLLSGGIDSGLLLALMNLNGSSWPTYTVGYGSSFADDELADAAETARVLGSKHTGVTITKSTSRNASQDRCEFGRAHRNFFDRSDVFRMPTGASGRQSSPGRARTGRIVWRISPSSRGAISRIVAGLPSWMRTPISSTVAALPRNETLKRGVHSLAIPDRMRRYQNVLSLLPGDQVEGLFHDGLLPRDSGTPFSTAGKI